MCIRDSRNTYLPRWCLLIFFGGAHQPVVILIFDSGAYLFLLIFYGDACLTARADGANQPVMLAFQPGATVLIRLSASEVALCA